MQASKYELYAVAILAGAVIGERAARSAHAKECL